MYCLVALAACVTVATASICCVPPQWEGVLGSITGISRGDKSFLAKGRTYMAYDAVNRRVGVKEYLAVGLEETELQLDVMLDYNSATRYVRKSDGTCVKTALGPWRDGCIPDTATLLSGDARLGVGANMLNVNAYRFSMGPSITIDLGVTADTCVPVIEIARGQVDNAGFLQFNQYLNITAGITDQKSMVIPPVGCESAPMLPNRMVLNPMSGAVGRRSFLGL